MALSLLGSHSINANLDRATRWNDGAFINITRGFEQFDKAEMVALFCGKK
jgi:hypothetical protein